jgi:CBS-domain-containing membrane protein
MFCGQLISSRFTPLRPADTVGDALLLMEEWQVSAMPVVEGDRYLGMLREEDLMDEESSLNLQALSHLFSGMAVRSQDHFLVAVKLSFEYDLTLVPVANEKQEWEGVVTQSDLFRQLAMLTGADEFGSMLVLEMERKEYAPGLMNRLVESNDALITQLNTWYDPATQLMTVVIRINKEDISDVMASFQRHGFFIRYYLGEEMFRNELQSNLEHLLNYLNI